MPDRRHHCPVNICCCCCCCCCCCRCCLHSSGRLCARLLRARRSALAQSCSALPHVPVWVWHPAVPGNRDVSWELLAVVIAVCKGGAEQPVERVLGHGCCALCLLLLLLLLLWGWCCGVPGSPMGVVGAAAGL